MTKNRTNEQIAMRVSIVSIIWNIMLTAFKLFSGIIGNSSAMISDAIHSASDIFSTFVVMIGVKISNKTADDDHQYGHERFECVAAILLSIMLAITGIGIGVEGFKNILGGHYSELKVPSMIALVAAITSIIVKEAMYWYTRAAGKKINSGALIADAWHHRSDALSSIGSFVGILGAILGFPVLDSVASVVICIFIIKVAVDIFKDATNKITDKACDQEIVTKIRQIISNHEEIKEIDLLRTRLFGNKIYVDIEISVDGTMPLSQSHEIAQNIHDEIENEFELVKHCMVHVNPWNE